MGNQPIPRGSPLSTTAAAPAPQIDASAVAPRILGGIFGAGSQPYFGRLSALSLLPFRGRGGEVASHPRFAWERCLRVCVCIYLGCLEWDGGWAWEAA